MFYVYVLKSISFNTRYVGFTENIQKRIEDHNNGKSSYTSGRTPWKLVYSEAYNTKAEAIMREKFLKSGKGRKFLDTMI